MNKSINIPRKRFKVDRYLRHIKETYANLQTELNVTNIDIDYYKFQINRFKNEKNFEIAKSVVKLERDLRDAQNTQLVIKRLIGRSIESMEARGIHSLAVANNLTPIE